MGFPDILEKIIATYDEENRVVHKAYRRTVGTVILKIESVYG
jgi:hypothetical protein